MPSAGGKREGIAYKLVLSIPTMRWIIASGALHNFNMYAIGGFLTPYVMRVHGQDVQSAGWLTMAVYGLAGVPGMILGGLWGDAILRRRRNGRMLLAAFAIALSVPLLYFALGQPAGSWIPVQRDVRLRLCIAVRLLRHGVLDHSGRDRAVAASHGDGDLLLPPCTSLAARWAQRWSARRAITSPHVAAANDGEVLENMEKATELKALEPYKGVGLNRAMYLLPLMSLLLAGTLFAGARTVTADSEQLQRWMRENAASEPAQPEPEKVPT